MSAEQRVDQSITKTDVMYRGQDLANLSEQEKYDIAGQVSKFLRSHKKSMLQFTASELVGSYINAGNAIAILDEQTKELAGFAKNHQWAGLNRHGNTLYEFGSWIVNPQYAGRGYGDLLALLASDTINQKDSDAQLVSVCSTHNPKSIHILKRLGAYEIAKPLNLDIILGGGKEEVVILDMAPLKNTLVIK